MKPEDIVNRVVDFVKAELSDNESAHDWWHVYRVWQLAKKIALEESKTHTINILIVELGALLHDIADYKFYGGDVSVGIKKARDFLSSLDVEEDVIEKVIDIIENISFKGRAEKLTDKSKEFEIVQDADRLDAIGAIGIARTFSYGGFKKRVIYDPNQKPKEYKSKEEYINSDSSTINHFYEKLLLLKDLMNTETGKHIAEHRHKFMELFLEEFFKEWNCEL